MKEAQIQSIFGKQNTIQGVFELKLCKTKSIRWDAVKPHQIKALLKATRNGLYHKISDSPIFNGMKTRFTGKKPFDCFYITADAYVVVCFYVPRKQKTCYYILIEDYLEAWKKSDKKSFNEREAEKISCDKIEL